MASQQVLFAETIAAMKKAFKRRAYEHHTNRGHKLKKKGRFAHKGQLVPASGPSAYKEEIDYAGVRRSIISRNPPLVDDDGYEVLSEDEPQRVESAIQAAAELNPYSNIRLEHILAPLTAATDLASHPTLSKPFISQDLTELVDHSCQLMRQENQSLWQVRQLWTPLYGDLTWIPCELMISENDKTLYTQDHVPRRSGALPARSGAATVNGDTSAEPERQRANGDNSNHDGDVSMADAGARNGNVAAKNTDTARDGRRDGENSSGDGHKDGTNRPMDAEEGPREEEEDGIEAVIHPIFLPPAAARPDRDLGLPASEAEDIRRLLALYIQKQEEVCRGTYRLHRGLLEAQRLRKDVLHWSKAEAHCGVNRDMSDGEDWYDKEEWGLTEDLKKGHDEEEEDTTTQAKKTRARR
ncbi:RXT2-lik [Cordyceps fumosorosea ARSEF 2679]|uniref:RXT2-lik n=1 Tax=Cordyceps fumosorosea (strain ARSEF 2679) TaxID=1081104 RepID=A0A167SCU2_CORFA|nr:RXT2-lik [Cordyceps fumosorosea ARSEF 2679]OAA59497.1 RXT2-lik [Cordyceps fumosorosea ARSEF 2679]